MNWTYSYNLHQRGRNRFVMKQSNVPFDAKLALRLALERLAAATAPSIRPSIHPGTMQEFHAKDAIKAVRFGI